MDNGARDRTWGGMMGRPSGWDVVDQGDDPVKGDPSTLRMMAREYQRISDAADDASTRLKSVKGSGWLTDWEGEAADVFVDAIEDTPSDLTKLVDSYELAATALSGWADTVDDTQYRADGALADAKDATGDLAAAQDRLADAQSTLSHYESASKDLSKVADKYPAGSDVPDGVDVPSPAQLRAASDNASVAQGSVSSAQGDISAAQSRIDAAKRLVADAKGDWQDAEQRTATKIGEAADAGLGKQSTWDKIFGSEAWETIVSVAKVVVAVGGIIAMIIPGPWTLVIAAIALVVLADTLYKMSKGEADGWDLAFSLLDCVPAGGAVGTLLKSTRIATQIARVGSISMKGVAVVGRSTGPFSMASRSARALLTRVQRPLAGMAERSAKALPPVRGMTGAAVNPTGRSISRLASNKAKAEFGEAQTRALFEAQGYVDVTVVKSVFKNGVDHVFHHPDTGHYVVVESKFSSNASRSGVDLLGMTKKHGLQMSDGWLNGVLRGEGGSRLRMGTQAAHRDDVVNALADGTLERAVVKISPDGSCLPQLLDAAARLR
ncbi:putative T7SS-secreted protein [Curtobacterium flaccumfaciens]|uniref:putative T7SS-secreted protein n=1 Tax=Curtobacterium flaccumfaciens TaxID=2035 RepID=UPI003CEFE096